MDYDDLSDVHLLGVRIEISDGVHGMWMGRQLCEVRDYGVPWTDEKILDYFQDLCKFYDAWSECVSDVVMPDSITEVQTLDLSCETFSKWKLIRSHVQGAYQKFPSESLVSILAALAITPTQYLQACTTGGIPKGVVCTAEFLDEVESAFLATPKIVWAHFAKRFGVNARTMKNICAVFAKRHIQAYGNIEGDRREARRLLNSLSLCTEGTPTHITTEVFDRTGVRFDLSAVTKIRKRNMNVL